MDTLALTLAAVLVSLLIGIPLGVWAGLSRPGRADDHARCSTSCRRCRRSSTWRRSRCSSCIGPASATIATLIYAMPPVVRITAHGIRAVPRTTVEAAESMGSTRWQTLIKVLLPMARRTITLGVNQTIMAALSMVTIAALIDAPGLGKTVIKALQTLDVGTAFNAGLAIVVLAIILDRVTTAAAERADATHAHSPQEQRRRQILLAVARRGHRRLRLPVLHLRLGLDVPHQHRGHRDRRRRGDHPGSPTPSRPGCRPTSPSITAGIKNGISRVVLDPSRPCSFSRRGGSPCAAVLALAAILGGLRAVIPGAVCLALLIGTGLWSDAMATLAATIVATAIVMVARHRRRGVDGPQRPGRPGDPAGARRRPGRCRAFVYLVPFLALFGASRFTAIVAAVVFAAPVAIKIVADGIRGVSPTTVEAATAAGLEHLAAHHQGAAADGAARRRARHQPGPHLRAVHGRGRRPGRRRRAGLRRGRRLLAEQLLRQGARRRSGHRAARDHARPRSPRRRAPGRRARPLRPRKEVGRPTCESAHDARSVAAP